jgi:hypothetical protein
MGARGMRGPLRERQRRQPARRRTGRRSGEVGDQRASEFGDVYSPCTEVLAVKQRHEADTVTLPAGTIE